MIINKKTSLGKKQLAIIVTASVLALLIIAYVIIGAVMGATSSPSDTDTTEPPQIRDGESVYGNSAVAYPVFYESAIREIVVNSHNGTFSMSRNDGTNPFIFYYVDENGETQVYYPEICNESGFDYTALYSIDQSDSMKMYKISYLANALGFMYFGDRIDLPDRSDPEERAAALARYGLSEEDREGIEVTYVDGDGEEQTIVIFVGDRLISGIGYYFLVSGRDYIYTGINNRFDYALGGFEDFLHTRLVAEGLEADGLYEPFLASDYKQWKNRVYSKSRDDGDGIFDRVVAGATVVGRGSLDTPIYDNDALDEDSTDGYNRGTKKLLSVNLNDIKDYPEFSRLAAALTGKAVGSYEDKIVASVISDTLSVDFGDGQTATYTYHVTAVESILTANGEYLTDAAYTASGESATMLKVTYDLYLGGEKKNEAPLHGILDLSDATVPAAAIAALSAESIGDTDVTFDVTYDKNTATSKAYTYVISEILLICEIDEAGRGVYTDTVTESSVVTYRYYYMVDGVKIGSESSRTVALSEITSGDDLTIKEKLLGKGTGSTGELKALEDVIYCQVMMNFDTYTFDTVEYYVTSELMTSFEFVNASDRDPFYGESLYKNTLPAGHKNYGYALNASACETVVKLLGGISGETSQYSEGLLGAECVAVGITPANMAKYGLYAYTVYFELPRGIEVAPKEEDDADSADDYISLSNLGFTLYISEPDEDGMRYVGSDMYDIIVKIDGATFDYLDNGFADFWARRSLVMVGYEDIDNMTVDLYMDDLYGSYNLEMVHETVWISGNQHLTEKPESGGQEYDFLTVNVSMTGACTETAFSRYIESEGLTKLSLAAIYNKVAGLTGNQGLTYGHDTFGTSNFKDFLTVMFSTYYGDTLTAEEKALASEDNRLMRISFTVTDSSPYPYVYEFYRIDDRRVMVSITQTGGSGQTVMRVDDFYISTFAFKKIVRNFTELLNGVSLNPDVGYGD